MTAEKLALDLALVLPDIPEEREACVESGHWREVISVS
jgi:hypothetical protein